MSYLVLARKWRPKRFAELVGQEHVVRALSNALDTGRLHHAFLFTGTRGVGKTTIARIFAKSLNCEQGTSAEPCGACNSCRDIDAGRFMDLLEIDAASNTGVDDVREVIENAQYMPSRGRVKVYLIDEVHMLSKAAFNALLKTLEEPPGHVKFLLATTDPQKLPVTVLSRCLQFNLKRLDEQQIGGQIHRILEAEGIAVEPGAVRQLSKAADGSLRDGLSLLDQAIAYTGGELTDAAVATMLGTVDRTRVGALLNALADGDGEALMGEIAELAEFSPDWNSVLEALTEALHRVQVRQLVPGVALEADGVDIEGLAPRVAPEVVQLWYQMAVNGRRDLPLAPSPRAGFEMSLLRMLAFRPAGEGGGTRPVPPAEATSAQAGPGAAGRAKAGSAAVPVAAPASAAAAARMEPVATGSTSELPPTATPTAAAPGAATASPPSPAVAAGAADDSPPWLEAGADVRAGTQAAPVGKPGDASQSEPVREPGQTPEPVVEPVPPPEPVTPPEPVPLPEPVETPEPVEEPEPIDPPERVASAQAVVEAAERRVGVSEPAASAVTSPEAEIGVSAASSSPSSRASSPSSASVFDDPGAWHDWVEDSPLKGPARVLAEHVGFVALDDDVLTLSLAASDELLNKPVLVQMIADALVPLLGVAPQIRFEEADGQIESLTQRRERVRDERQATAEATFLADPDVRRLIEQHGARVVPNSIRPFDDAGSP